MQTIWKKVRPYAKRLYAIAPFRLRLGRKYWQLREFLHTAQWWTTDEIRQWQLQRLRQMLRYAYQNVPGYYQLYHEAGIKPDDLENLEGLRFFPMISKNFLSDHAKDFQSRDPLTGSKKAVTTSGSSGIPLVFYYTATNTWMEYAFIHTSWSWAGWSVGDKSVVLRGGWVGDEEHLWFYQATTHELLLSSFFLSDKTYPRYLEKLQETDARFLQAYPSMAAILAEMMLTRGDCGKYRPEVILTCSENLQEWQKARLRQAFPGVRLFDFYGHTEEASLAPWCESSETYHAWPFYGITELLDENGREVTQGERAEIVSTSFWNYGTPFIRYRTQDLAVKGPASCPYCRRNFQIIEKIEGRMQEMIISATGRTMPVTALCVHSDDYQDIRQLQFYQDTPGKVILRIVPRETFSVTTQENFLKSVRTKLDRDMQLTIELVDEIKQTRGGKYQLLEQKIPLPEAKRIGKGTGE
jgi:phenylacetate-CoA ligase